MSSSAGSSAVPSSTPPCVVASASTHHVHYNGEVQQSDIDIASTGFGGTLQHAGKYSNQMLQAGQLASPNYGNGYNWLISSSPHVISDGSDLVIIFDSKRAFWFDSNSPYAPRYGAKHKLTYDYVTALGEYVYTMTAPNGYKQQFFDLNSASHPSGAFYKAFLPGGQTIEATYHETEHWLTELKQSDGQNTESLEYTYTEVDSTDMIETVTLVRNSTNLRRVVYEYYESLVEHKGSIGDLKSATRQDYVNGEWVTRDVHFYQYYTDSEGAGFQHGLRYVVGPEAYRRMVAAGKDPETANDVEDYADNYFEYDANQRADNAEVAGGTRIYLFGYTTNPSGNYTDGYNNWKTKTVEDRSDGSKLTVYTNYLGQPLLKHLAEASPGTDEWIEYFKYGETEDHNEGQLVLHALPAAIADGYDPLNYEANYLDLGGESVIVHATEGLVELTEYGDDTTAAEENAGDVIGYVKSRSLRKGRNQNSVVKLSETTYYKRTVTTGGQTTYTYPVAEQIAYPDASNYNDKITTTFSYSWYDDSHQIQERTTTPETVTTAKNGSDSSNYRYEYFDEYGNLTWSKDERGRVTYHQYDIAAGARTRTIQDVDGYQSAELDPPTGYAGQSGGLHLISDFQNDDQGRVTRSLGPAHLSTIHCPLSTISVRTAVWTVYDDENHEIRSARGYARESRPGSDDWDVFELINPVNIVKQDAAGRTVESISAVWPGTVDQFLAAEPDDFPQTTYSVWTTNTYNDFGRLTSTKKYHNVPGAGEGFSGTNYAQTTFDYEDAMCRQNMQKTPGGTITRYVFDCRDNVVEEWIGTDDTNATDADPTGNDHQDNNMAKVVERTYDNCDVCACSGGLTGGLLSTLTQYVNHDEPPITRVTDFEYDWRNRLEYTIHPADDADRVTYDMNYYDNIDRITKVERYWDDDEDIDDNDPEPWSNESTPGDDQILARTKNYYDELSRVYKTERYAVDPTDSTANAIGNALTSKTWYDAAGNVIKQKPAGSDSFTKTVHDGLNRPIKTYVGLDTDETSYADAATVDGDTIFEQTETTYNPANQVTWTVTRGRMHDATGTGELSSPDGFEPRARAAYSGVWYDPLGQQIAAADFGTVAPAEGRPEEPPARSDDVLVSSVEYDSAGMAYRTVDARGREDRQEFDAAGRVVRTVANYSSGSSADDKNVTVEFTYAPDGGEATQTAKNSTTGDQVTQYAYGTTLADSEIADTRLLRGIVYPDSQNTFTMAGGAPTFSGTYNRVEFTYNCQGEQVTKKDQNETVHTFEYDLLGRQTSDKITAVDGDIFQGILRIERGYEVRGMVEQVTSYDVATGGYSVNDVKFTYDDFGLLKTDQQEHLGDVGAGSLSVQYARANGADNHARLNTVTYPNGRVLHHEYSNGNDSDLSRVSYLSETNGSGTRYAAYTYLGAGRIVRVDCNKISDNDPTHRCNLAFGTDNDPYDGLDQFGRVIDLRWTNYAGTTDLVGIKHGYDRASNRLWRRDVVSAAQATPVYLDELYAYDGMYQLTSLRRGQLNSTEDALVEDSKKFAEQWTLDPLGNWTNFKQDTDADSDWELDQTRAHNKANEIAAIGGSSDHVAHDAAGNMTVAPKPEDWGDHYHFIYDPWNRLVEVQTADQTKMVRAYEYDGLDRMIGKWSYDEDAWSLSEWRHYYYSDKWQFLEERVADSYAGPYSGSGIPGFSGWGIYGSGVASNFRLDRQYVWGLRYVNDLVLRDRDTNTNGSLDERLYALQDPNWNVVAIANTSGAIQERYCYSAYGKPSFLTSAFAVRDPDVSSYDWETLYSGYRYDYHADSDVKWHIAGHRILLSHLGRWNRRDPIGYDADDKDLYRYCGNNPVMYVDPSGLVAIRCQCSIETFGGFQMTGGSTWVTADGSNGSTAGCTTACNNLKTTMGGPTTTIEWTGRWEIVGSSVCPVPGPSGCTAARISSDSASYDKCMADYYNLYQAQGIYSELEKNRDKAYDILNKELAEHMANCKKKHPDNGFARAACQDAIKGPYVVAEWLVWSAWRAAYVSVGVAEIAAYKSCAVKYPCAAGK